MNLNAANPATIHKMIVKKISELPLIDVESLLVNVSTPPASKTIAIKIALVSIQTKTVTVLINA